MTPTPPEPAEPAALSVEQSRAVDAYAEKTLGLPSAVLMENAAINAAAAAIDLLDARAGLEPAEARVAVVCGPGNNGGDGFAMARHLVGHGAGVTVYSLKPLDALRGDAAINAGACRAAGIEVVVLGDAPDPGELSRRWAEADLLVDAVLGTGIKGEVREPAATVVRAINAASGPAVVALDTPSGLDCDSGTPADPTTRADLTVTFVARKKGFDAAGASRWTGRVVVADIGLPPAAVRAALAAHARG